MRKTLQLLVLVVMLVVAALGSSAAPASANSCTPGFWKNHTSIWDANGTSVTGAYTTDSTVGDVFNVAGSTYADSTLLEALSFQGGSGISGAQQILLRAATARLLNLAGTNNATQVQIVVTRVHNLIMNGGTRDQMIAQAERWDAFNNSGGCSTFGG